MQQEINHLSSSQYVISNVFYPALVRCPSNFQPTSFQPPALQPTSFHPPAFKNPSERWKQLMRVPAGVPNTGTAQHAASPRARPALSSSCTALPCLFLCLPGLPSCWLIKRAGCPLSRSHNWRSRASPDEGSRVRQPSHARSFLQCFFNGEPGGRYVCCDTQGCAGFNADQTPHCANYGYVPPNYGATAAPAPAGNPPPASPPSGAQGTVPTSSPHFLMVSANFELLVRRSKLKGQQPLVTLDKQSLAPSFAAAQSYGVGNKLDGQTTFRTVWLEYHRIERNMLALVESCPSSKGPGGRNMWAAMLRFSSFGRPWCFWRRTGTIQS
jgi:hypothetical protein